MKEAGDEKQQEKGRTAYPVGEFYLGVKTVPDAHSLMLS